MVAQSSGRFSAHFEYEQPVAVPIDQFPFFGAAIRSDPLEIAPLKRPQVPEPPRPGVGGVDCLGCTQDDSTYLWSDANWRVFTPDEPAPLFHVLVSPREHYEELPDLPPARAAELGPVLQRAEAALRSLGDVGQVHTHKWGDGGAHLHLWQIVRPAGMLQARGVGLTVWLRALPPLPKDAWEAAGRDFARGMARSGGTAHR